MRLGTFMICAASLALQVSCIAIQPGFGGGCHTGKEDCPCTQGGGCDPGLTCFEGVCEGFGNDGGDDGGPLPDLGDDCGEEDDDGDGVGNLCDVCHTQGYDDDLEDYDGDGVPCFQDWCSFDGPENPLPTSVQAGSGTVANATINDVGEPRSIIGPGAAFSLEFDYQIIDCGCPNCIVQGLTGYVPSGSSQCFYNNVPGCVGEAGPWARNMLAPEEPGTYFIGFRTSLQFECLPDLSFPEANIIAAICVPDLDG